MTGAAREKNDDKNVAPRESCIRVSRIGHQHRLLRVLPVAPALRNHKPLHPGMSGGNAYPMDGMENKISPRSVRRDDGED